MITIFSPEHALHDSPHELLEGALVVPHESPRRAELIHAAVERARLGLILAPRALGDAPIRAIHDSGYLSYLEHAYERWVAAGGSPAAVLPDTFAVRWMGRPPQHPLSAPGYYAFDLSTAIVAGTYQAARASADVALSAAALLLEGEPAVYALCRPPGHHAGIDMAGGYCFLNNAAIAAEFLGTQGVRGDSHQRVAVLDIDFHHGNGTQQIFYKRDDVLFVSLHGDPARYYPFFAGFADERGAGVGLGHTLNLPLPEGTGASEFLAALDQGLAAIIAFEARFLVVSAGFDTFQGDPLGGFTLAADAYPEIGRRIKRLGLPTLIVQEGGYAIDALGDNVVGLLSVFAR